jgi:uncharacterized protein YbjQ (UPF0145 family)
MVSVMITRVVTRSIVGDTVGWIQNLIGHRIRGYEKMAQKGFEELQKEFAEKYPGKKLLWYRLEFTQLTDGALFMAMYGEME